MTKHRKHRVKNDPDVTPHDHHYRSEASTDKNRFFHQAKAKGQGATQTTTVTVNVEQPATDCMTGCLSLFTKCFKSGS